KIRLYLCGRSRSDHQEIYDRQDASKHERQGAERLGVESRSSMPIGRSRSMTLKTDSLIVFILLLASSVAAPAQLITTSQPVYGPRDPGAPTFPLPPWEKEITSPPSFLEQYQSAVSSLVARISPSVVAIQVDHRPDQLAPGHRAVGSTSMATGSGVII